MDEFDASCALAEAHQWFNFRKAALESVAAVFLLLPHLFFPSSAAFASSAAFRQTNRAPPPGISHQTP